MGPELNGRSLVDVAGGRVRRPVDVAPAASDVPQARSGGADEGQRAFFVWSFAVGYTQAAAPLARHGLVK